MLPNETRSSYDSRSRSSSSLSPFTTSPTSAVGMVRATLRYVRTQERSLKCQPTPLARVSYQNIQEGLTTSKKGELFIVPIIHHLWTNQAASAPSFLWICLFVKLWCDLFIYLYYLFIYLSEWIVIVKKLLFWILWARCSLHLLEVQVGA